MVVQLFTSNPPRPSHALSPNVFYLRLCVGGERELALEFILFLRSGLFVVSSFRSEEFTIIFNKVMQC